MFRCSRVSFIAAMAFALPAGATPASDAIATAIKAVHGDSPECKKGVLRGLKDARDALATNQDKATIVTARRAVEDSFDMGSDGCKESTRQSIEAALTTLKSKLDQKGATEASAANAIQLKKDCWNYRNDYTPFDKGCLKPLKGVYPMGKADFEKVIAEVSSTPDRFEKTRVLTRRFNWQAKDVLTAWQLDVILGKLSNPVDKLEIVKLLAKRVTNPEQGNRIGSHFSDGRIRRDALEELQKKRY